MDAILFTRDCGATDSYSSQISVLASGEDEDDGGNAFISDANHGAAQTNASGGPWVDMQWTSETELRVHYATGSRLFRSKGSVGAISISYLETSAQVGAP